ncbi:MAG: CsgG/HfaB family protein [Kiritimatiellae bacterium]|nr:CsgG/HfaB family protein [Kiritimatiellia bacterium]MDD4341860.1 CsgG/HfaB family protein [Kiritimatiellia bacterium]MDY0150209.1 CsgG/HfaB family protein [Kiritimatiellia bacterium]
MKPTHILLLLLIGLLTGCASPYGSSSGGGNINQPNVFVSWDAADIQKVGILPFKASTELIGASVSDMFVTEFMKMGRYDLVERSQMSGVLGETEVALSGLSSGQAAQLGQMIGAQGVIIGTVSEYEKVALSGRAYPVVGISIRLIHSGTGQIIWSVDYAKRGGRNATLSQHARSVVQQMVTALTRQLP